MSAYLREDFMGDIQRPLDAPRCVPSGHTKENIVTGIRGMDDTRAIIGGIVWVR